MFFLEHTNNSEGLSLLRQLKDDIVNSNISFLCILLQP